MKLQITIDDTVLKDIFIPPVNNQERLNRARRINYHTLVSSKELLKVWEEGIKHHDPIGRYGDWLNQIINSPDQFKLVPLPGKSKAKDSCTPKEKALLNTSYESDSGIVIGDFSPKVTRDHPELDFVSIKDFSSNKKQTVTLREIEETISNKSNVKKHLFDIFETPVTIDVEKNSSAKVLSEYLSYFYDDQVEIQDLWLPRNLQNEENFDNYILPYLNKKTCKVTIVISTEDGALHKQRLATKYNEYNVNVKCIPKIKDPLHKGYIRTLRYKITIPYRMYIFGDKGKGQGGKNQPDFITISRL